MPICSYPPPVPMQPWLCKGHADEQRQLTRQKQPNLRNRQDEMHAEVSPIANWISTFSIESEARSRCESPRYWPMTKRIHDHTLINILPSLSLSVETRRIHQRKCFKDSNCRCELPAKRYKHRLAGVRAWCGRASGSNAAKCTMSSRRHVYQHGESEQPQQPHVPQSVSWGRVSTSFPISRASGEWDRKENLPMNKSPGTLFLFVLC
jgi:hypothetical protein